MYYLRMTGKNTYKITACPMTYVLEILGDKWSFLIIRDMLFKGSCQYKEFIDSDEGMATNILADRLKKLTYHGLITKSKDPNNGRQKLYHLTEKGLDLIPSILHLLKWSGKHDSKTLMPNQIKSNLNDRFEESVEYVRNQYLNQHGSHDQNYQLEPKELVVN